MVAERDHNRFFLLCRQCQASWLFHSRTPFNRKSHETSTNMYYEHQQLYCIRVWQYVRSCYRVMYLFSVKHIFALTGFTMWGSTASVRQCAERPSCWRKGMKFCTSYAYFNPNGLSKVNREVAWIFHLSHLAQSWDNPPLHPECIQLRARYTVVLWTHL